jgi:hypothetical protein
MFDCHFSLLVSNNCFVKRSADASFYSCIRTLVFMFDICKCCHKTNDLRRALNSLMVVEREITDRVCRKSPDNKMSEPPKTFILVYDLLIPILF